MSNESTSVQHLLATDNTLARVVDALEDLPTGLQQAKDNANSAANRANAAAAAAEQSAIQTMLGLFAILGPVEGTTASTDYSVGDSFIYGGALYKVTSVIASGDAIVPDTNCTQTTIIDLLKGT